MQCTVSIPSGCHWRRNCAVAIHHGDAAVAARAFAVGHVDVAVLPIDEDAGRHEERAALELSGLPLAVPSEESNTPFLPICSSSLLPSCEYFCTIPDGRAGDPDIAVLVEVTAVQARIEQIQVAPGMDDIARRHRTR